MKITEQTSSIRTLKKGNPNFMIHDGLMVSPRAGFEINEKCPREYRQIIAACIDRGWLNPVAYMSDKELMTSGLLK